MHIDDILSKVDHTLLSPAATWEDIKTIIDDGIQYNVASVCIPPSFVRTAADYAQKRVRICTVIGFPNGYNTTEVKVFETLDAVSNGADELDTVINIGDLKAKNYAKISNEIRQIKAVCGNRILKVIIETCLLTDDEKRMMCDIVSQSGADYIKTSTGFSTGGATAADIALFAASISGGVKIKAAGGISGIKDAQEMIALGASRLGTSRIVKIIKEKKGDAANADASY